MMAAYFVLSWTPKLLISAGLDARAGIAGGVLLNLGGIVGGTAFALLSRRIDAKLLTLFSIAGFSLLIVVFGVSSSVLAWAYWLAATLGVFLFGAMVGLYVLVPAAYPAETRMSGMRYALGVGRAGAIAPAPPPR